MKKSYLIPMIVALTFIILGLPLFIYGIDKTLFYDIDPDVVYITNALYYTKYHLISYADHPGTPTIVLLHYSFFPLRLIVKYILHQNFIQWSFDNYSLLTYYTRIFELLLANIAFFIYLKVIKKISDSNWILFLSALAVFSFAGLTSAAWIVPENLSFFLVAVWLSVFIFFIKKRNFLLNELLVFIAGFAVANKFTSLFLLVPSLFLHFFIRRFNLGQKFAGLMLNVLIAGLAFYIGILPVLGRFTYIINWAVGLFNHADFYATGNQAIFDPQTYSSSMVILIRNHPILFIFICFTLILGVILLFKKKLNIIDPVIFLLATSSFGFIVFAKYPTIRYNYANILLIIFCAAYFLSKSKKYLTKIILPIMIIVFLMSSMNYLTDASNILTKKQVETPQSVLNAWTPGWSYDIFREQLDAVGYYLKP